MNNVTRNYVASKNRKSRKAAQRQLWKFRHLPEWRGWIFGGRGIAILNF